MHQQLREAVAAHPDGIAMMGHPGEAAILPLAEQAAKAGIKMMYQNVPVPAAVDKVGGGYVGAQQAPQGHALGVEIVRRFGLKQGDLAIVHPGLERLIRNAREEGTAKALEEAGVKVVRLASVPEWAADPNLAIPVITAAFQANPDGQGDRLSRRPEARQRRDLDESRRQEAGRDLQCRLRHQPADRRGVQGGWVQLTADQQPFQQGYLPILSLCEQIVYGLAPINVDTGAGFVTPENYKAVADLATEGLALDARRAPARRSSRRAGLARCWEQRLRWPNG